MMISLLFSLGHIELQVGIDQHRSHFGIFAFQLNQLVQVIHSSLWFILGKIKLRSLAAENWQKT